jgi:hypothetical protein
MVLILGIQKYDTIMLKKATMLAGKENYTCVSLIESNSCSYQDVSRVVMGIQILTRTLAIISTIFQIGLYD